MMIGSRYIGVDIDMDMLIQHKDSAACFQGPKQGELPAKDAWFVGSLSLYALYTMYHILYTIQHIGILMFMWSCGHLLSQNIEAAPPANARLNQDRTCGCFYKLGVV